MGVDTTPVIFIYHKTAVDSSLLPCNDGAMRNFYRAFCFCGWRSTHMDYYTQAQTAGRQHEECPQ